MIGPTAVLYDSDSPVSFHDEQGLILAHAYRLAYQEHLSSSFGKRFLRALHMSKPKRVAVVARIAYRLKIVPFSTSEVLVSDSCSLCTEGVDVVSIDPRLFVDTGRKLLPSAKTDEEQTRFIIQLKTVDLVAKGFKTVGYRSPFLSNSNTLAGEIVGFLGTSELPSGGTAVVESEFEIANHPEEIRDALSGFLRNSNAYADSLATTKNLTEERSRVMFSLLNERYPIKEESFETTVSFGWEFPKQSSDRLVLLKPTKTLVDGLKTEVKPELDAIERQNDVEKGKLEQRSELERRELERTYDTQIENAEKDKELEIKRLDLERKSYEKQLDNVESQYRLVSKALSSAREEFDELTEAESETTAERLTEKIAGLKQDVNELAEKKSTIAQTLENVESELDAAEDRHEKRIGSLREAKTEALKDHRMKLKIQTDALEELKRRNMSDKLSHVTEVEKDVATLEELIKMSTPASPKATETIERFELPALWSDRALLERKTGAIQSLSRSIVEKVDRASKTMEESGRFLQSHLIRLNSPAPSVTVDVVVPFWYVEIESDGKEGPSTETYVVPPSNLVPNQPGQKEKSLLGVDFIPTKPSIASAIDSIKGYKNVRACGRSNSQLDQMNPTSLLSHNNVIMQRQLVSKDLFEAIQSDFKKRNKIKGNS